MDNVVLVDPFEVVGPLCASLVLGCLTPRELCQCGAVSRSWRVLALENQSLWFPHLEKLWSGKVYVPAALRNLAQVSARAAYVASLLDANRQLPTDEELGIFTWVMSFKAISWFSPALNALTVHRYFNSNHTVTAPAGDPLWGDVEPQRHYWYFRRGPDGSMVLQVNTYPFLRCHRTPKWGWEMQNAIVRLQIDAAAGPNPGLPSSHPAAAENLSLGAIEERFNSLLRLQGEEDDMEDEDEDEEEEVEGG